MFHELKNNKTNIPAFILSYFIFIASLIMPITSFATLYEDAEDGNTQGNVPANVKGWFIYDNSPGGATISNVYDADKQSQVIQFTGVDTTTNNGYMLGDWHPHSVGSWNNTNEFNVHWCSKYSNDFVMYMRVYTSNYVSFTYNGIIYNTNQRYIYYTPSNIDHGVHSHKAYIHHGLGADKTNGQWHSIHRDLLADLQEYEPTNTITSVTAFLIRANGRVDDIHLTQAPLKPEINLKKMVQTLYDPANGTSNPKAIPGAILEYTLKAENFGFKHADNNSTLLSDNIPSNMKTCVANIGQCKKPYLVTATNSSGMNLGTVSYTIGGVDTTTPPADADGFNSSVTAIKIAMTGVFPDLCSGSHSFEVKFRAGIE